MQGIRRIINAVADTRKIGQLVSDQEVGAPRIEKKMEDRKQSSSEKNYCTIM